MLKKLKRLGLVLIIIIFFTNTITIAEESSKRPLFIKPYDATLAKEVERARQTVRMIDDMYKTFIVLITKQYVDDPSVLPAAALSKRVFEAMSKKGWHKARLLDATGSPFNPDNNPRDDFERDAIDAIKSGKSYFERVERIDGRNYYRAATALAADMEGCTFCHPDKKLGDILGAISYGIPL
ncbi:MAG: DUF3365 domain-containing protein [Candidatus Scalinduaceae bacterium]